MLETSNFEFKLGAELEKLLELDKLKLDIIWGLNV